MCSARARGDLHDIATPAYQSGSRGLARDLGVGQYTVPDLDRLCLEGPLQYRSGSGVFGAARAAA